MKKEELDFEFQQAQIFFGVGNKNSGSIVETKTGLVGRTYNNEDLINGKIRVYTEKCKMLCDPNSLILKGFID